MWPTSVAIPVAIATIVPAPRVTWVFMNARSTRSPRAASAATRVGLLRDRGALAGQGRLVDLERRRADDPSVGRHEVARLDVDDVARDELLHRDLDQLAVAPDLRLDDHHLLERGDARGRLALLVEAHRRVEQRQDDEDDGGLQLVREEQAHDARDEQDDLHRIAVLAQERLPARLLGAFVESVEPVTGPSRLDLGRGQARCGVDVLRPQRRVYRQRVPRGLALGTRGRRVQSHVVTSGRPSRSAGVRRPTSRPSRARRASAASATRT